MLENIKITYKEISDDPIHCECCGTCYPEGFSVSLNNEIIYEYYSDGHLGGYRTEGSLINILHNELKTLYIDNIKSEFTEKARLEWNEKHPGNRIARTPERWADYKNNLIKHVEDSFCKIKEFCKILPYDEHLQIKLFLIWFEDVMGDKIEFKMK